MPGRTFQGARLVRGGDRSLEPRVGARGVGAEFVKDRVLRSGRADVARIDLSVEVRNEVPQSRFVEPSSA